MKTFRERVDAIKRRMISTWNMKNRAASNKEYERIVAPGSKSFIAAPDVLQAVAEFSPVKTDLLDVGRFMRAKANEHVLANDIRSGSSGYAPFVNAAQHLWSSLIGYDPELQVPEGEKPQWFDFHAAVMQAFMDMPEYKELHKSTAGSPLYTSLAMHSLLPVVRKLIDEMMPPPQGGDGDSENDNEDDSDQDGSSGGGGGDDEDEDEDEDEDKDDKQDKNKPDGKKDSPEESKKKLQDALRKAMSDAKKDNDDAETAFSNCGKGPPSDLGMDPSAYAELARAFKNNPTIKNIVNMVGRLGRIAHAKAAKPIPGFAGYGTRITFGEEISRTPDYKVSDLCVKALRSQFLIDMCSGELPQISDVVNAPPSRGPVVVLTDESGSMQDGKHLIAKALAIASIRTAEEYGRKSFGISFADGSREYDTGSPTGLLEYMKSNLDGGTNFEDALSRGVNLIKTKRSTQQADIMILTDGCCPVSDEFVKKFSEWKYRAGARLFAVIVGSDANYYLKDGLAKIADSVTTVAKLNNDADAVAAFKEFWSHIADSPITHKELDKRADELGADVDEDAALPGDDDDDDD